MAGEAGDDDDDARGHMPEVAFMRALASDSWVWIDALVVVRHPRQEICRECRLRDYHHHPCGFCNCGREYHSCGTCEATRLEFTSWKGAPGIPL